MGVFTIIYKNDTMFVGYKMLHYSVVTIYDTSNAISNGKGFELLYSYFLKYVLSGKYGCSSLMSCFPGMLLTYCQNDSEMIPFAPFIIITFVVACHTHCVSVVRALWLLPDHTSISWH